MATFKVGEKVKWVARKIGYGGAMEEGIKRVEEGLKRLGIKK